MKCRADFVTKLQLQKTRRSVQALFRGKLATASHKVGKGGRMGFWPAKPSLTSMLSVNFWLSS